MNQDNQLHLLPFAESMQFKELGFDWPCHYAHISENRPPFMPITPDNFNDRTKFDTGFSAPTLDHACKWLRDVKKVDISIMPFLSGTKVVYSGTVYVDPLEIKNEEEDSTADNYEQCQLDCIKVAIEHLQSIGIKK